MDLCSLRKSAIDPEFFEIVAEGTVLQEVKICFKIYRIPKHFPSLNAVLSWIKETEHKLAKGAAYRMLGRKNYSKATLDQKLKLKGFSSTICHKVIDDLEKLGYLSDANLAEQTILQKIHQGYGPFYIEQYLKQQGLNTTLVRKIMDEKTQKETIKKWAPKLKNKEKTKQIAFLLRKGFDFNLCHDFIHKFYF